MPINKGYLSARTDKASDEVYTPAYAVKPIIKYLKMFDTNATVWCPFDLSSSHYVKELEKAGFKVIHTHIDEGQNFFTYEPEEEYDIIISNPPFSIKDDILKRLYELKNLFAEDAERIYKDATPQGIIELFGLEDFDYTLTSKYGHFGFNEFPWENK